MPCCKEKDNDLGGDDFSTGKVSFKKFGMQVYFPENKWGNQDSTRNEPGYEREGIFTFLKESGGVINNQTYYSVHISFWRFISSFEDESEANKKVGEIKEIYDYWMSVGENYSSVGSITSSQISNYPALKIESETKNNSIEKSYFVYHGKRLYWIAVVMPKNSMYSAECEEIINTLEITDN